MKFSLFSKIIIASLVLMIAGTVFAANGGHKHSFQISEPILVNGTKLPVGEYQVSWDGAGPAVQMSIAQGKKVVLTVPAQLVELNEPARDTATETRSNANGDHELTGLLFSGKKYSLKLGSESASSENKAASTN